jgi:hypothetical protein
MKRTRITEVEETDYGLYLWEMPDGSLVADDQKNFLNIPAKKNDREKIKLLTDTVKSFGIHEGHAVFWAGHRRVTDEEYEYQKQRMEWGLIPDELDYGAARDELMSMQKRLK